MDRGEFQDQRQLADVTVGQLIERYKTDTKRAIGRSQANSLRQLERGLTSPLAGGA